MDRNKIKEDVLQELIDLMDEKEVEGLKSKSPKFMTLEMEATKLPDEETLDHNERMDEPSRDEELENMKRIKEFKGDAHDRHMDMIDSLDGGMKNKMFQGHMDANKLQENDDEDDLRRLMNLYKDLK